MIDFQTVSAIALGLLVLTGGYIIWVHFHHIPTLTQAAPIKVSPVIPPTPIESAHAAVASTLTAAAAALQTAHNTSLNGDEGIKSASKALAQAATHAAAAAYRSAQHVHPAGER